MKKWNHKFGIRKEHAEINQRGSILLVFIITLPFLITIALYYMSLSLTSFQVARFDQFHSMAQLAADAGADYSIEQLNLDNNWSTTGGEVTLHTDSQVRTTYNAHVVSTTKSIKTVAVTGKTYRPANASVANRSVSIYIDIRPVTTGLFGIIGGEGGLYMSNSSKIVGGDVFINGDVHLQNTSQIGLSTKPLVLKVADQICPVPPDATYPQVCAPNAGPQPITVSTNGNIYATVKATNQTNGTNMYSPGLVAGSTVAPEPLPTYDRDAQKSAITVTKTPSQATCSGNNGTLTWPANLKITGDVVLSNGCVVTIMGNVWITGKLLLTQSSQIVVPDSLGTNRPVIMVDGSAGAGFNNTSQLIANSSDTGVEVITFWANAGCSPDCSSVTGLNLYNSRNVSTISLNNSGDAPNSIFYAYWSQVTVGQSGAIGAIIGQTINLSNNGTISFGAPQSTGDITWVFKGYRRQ